MNYVNRPKSVKPEYDAAAVCEKSRKKRPAPISMRFNEVQLAKLRPYAGNQSLGVYCRDFILKNHNIGAGGKKPKLFPDQHTKAQILREIGLSGIGENLQVIRSNLESNKGADLDLLLPMVSQACSELAVMRSLLLKSLNVHDRRNT